MTLAQAHPLTPAVQRTDDHRYYYEGREYPSVTTILGVLDKSAGLMSWAARQTAEAAVAVNEAPGFDSLIASVGVEGVIKALTSRSSWKRDEAAQLGTAVHALADDVVSGRATPANMPEGVASRVKHYIKWWETAGWTLRLSEAYVVAPAVPGAHTGYAGTFDLLARDRDGKTVLADVKTGKGVYREAILQLAGYGMAPLVARATDEKAYPMPQVDRYVVLHVTTSGVRPIELSVGSADQMAFLSCLDLYQWTKSVKGRL